MQTRPYGDLFSLISNMIGAVTLAADEQTQVANFINRRYFEAFQESPVWPRYVVTGEERDIIALTLTGSGTSVVNQDYILLGSNTSGGLNVYQGTTTNTVIIYNTGSAWRVDTAASASEQSNGTYTVTSGVQRHIEEDVNKKSLVYEVEVWNASGLIVTPRQMIPYAETGKTTIGDFNRIHRKKPFLNNSAIEYDFFTDKDGANILNIANTEDSTAFITYKEEFAPFTVTSDYYNSTVSVPIEFFNYIAHSVYADFLRVQNRQQEAIAEEGVARNYLAQELEKVDLRMNNSTINKRFSTYVSRQSR